jgi:glycosyltransferase involved in cell wall biosynthesis
VVWRFGLRHHEVAAWLHHAECSVAPLTDCPRNVEQGCCPLKVLESMAAGTPVVASDLPVVRELVTDGEHGRLVRPDRPAELARAIRILLEYPDRSRQLGAQARAHVAEHLTWDHNRARLTAVIDGVLGAAV